MRPLNFTTLLTLLLFSLNLFAYHDASVLRIQTMNHMPIIVEINGIEQNHTPVPVFEVTNMASGKHRIRIFTIERVGRRAFKHEIFKGRIHVTPASIVTGVIRYGSLTVTNQPLIAVPVCCTAKICKHHSHGNYGKHHDRRYDDHSGDRYHDRYNYDNRYDNNDRYDYRYENNYGRNYDNSYNRGMNSDDFKRLKRMIDRQSFEDSKLKIAKQATRDNYLTSAQVREIMQLFTFESTKLDFAKYAYDNVTDRNRYYTIYDAFTFSSSIDEMERIIR